MSELQTNWHRKLLWGMAILFAVFMFLIPLVSHVWEIYRTGSGGAGLGGITIQSLTQFFSLQLVESLFVLLALGFGSSIGSFLNVVAYRMPRKLSVIFNPSHCPNCSHPIKARDNLPILGWILLQGKCRNCGEPISPRYPIVEAIAGAIFLFLFLVQLTSGGANLPLRESNIGTGVLWTVMDTRWDLMAICLYHAALFMLLLTLALFDFDRQAVPRRFLLFALVAAALPPFWVKGLLLVPNVRKPGTLELPTVMFETMMVGGAAGLFLSLIHPKVREYGRKGLLHPFAIGLILIGIALGWQAMVVITALWLVSYLIGRVPAMSHHVQKVPATGCLLIATIVHHSFWKWFT